MSSAERTLIGIAGASGSGKSTLALKWAKELAVESVVCFDSYYNSLKAHEDGDTKNFDHPSALDFELFREHLHALKQGKSVSVPRYDFVSHTRSGSERVLPNADYILVEGILLLHFPAIRALLDYSVFLDVPFEICMTRRVKRDCTERGREKTQALRQIEETVEPMYREIVWPSREFADIRICDNSLSAHQFLKQVR